ncbi:hypothetical protein SLS62_002834 [Diatrype stigma]|uniref:Uncharacterized protein n=1 Tax=Diatrype stigma TaxID=117547 RepID=A0AAN9UZ87_9PEZI
MADGSDEVVHTGPLRWFSSDQTADEGPAGWRLDVVTLLAVIGESSIADHAQTITASMVCLLPRIIPAPQALLKPSRPQRLPEVHAKMTGVYSGVNLDSVGFFANILHPLDEMQPFSFKVLRITHADSGTGTELDQLVRTGRTMVQKALTSRRTNSRAFAKAPANGDTHPPPNDEPNIGRLSRASGINVSADIEAGPPQPGISRRPTMKEKVQDILVNPRPATNTQRPAIPPSLYSPVHVLSVFSMLVTIGIIIAAAIWSDGTAIIAVSLISMASSIVGLASWWRPLLMSRAHKNKVPDGDVLIRTREGGFLLIKCSEEVARELYAGTDECKYRVGPQAYQALMGISTLTIMVSVILLGNCKWKSQVFIGAAYITLNGLYWGMSLIPKKYFWDLSRYVVKDITPEDAKNAHITIDATDEGTMSFTRTLWYAVRETRLTSWVEKNGAAPNTPQWRMWLDEAEEAAKKGHHKWPAVSRKNAIMDSSKSHTSSSPAQNFDEAQQKAPATEIQSPAQNPYQNTL